MSFNQRTFFLGLLALGLVCTGCLISPKKEKPKPDLPNYAKDLSVPDSLIHNLIESYTRREINPYANLLARDYKFQFQEEDEDFPNGMNFTQDSTSTYNMFESSVVTSISLTMTTKPPFNGVFEGEPTKVVQISNLLLDINLGAGDIKRVQGDVQEYHMALGKEENGEIPTRYYIRAWLDIAGSLAPPKPPSLSSFNKGMDLSGSDDKVTYVTMSELHKLMGSF